MISLFSKSAWQKKLHIRKAESSDLSDLSKIHSESFKRGWSDGEIEKLLGNDAYSCLVIHQKQSKSPALDGFIIYRTVIDEAEIITIAIRSGSRRKGAARKLLETTIRNLQYERAARFFLEVDETNSAAINLYKKFGFQITGRREGYYEVPQDSDGKKPTALVMERQLG